MDMMDISQKKKLHYLIKNKNMYNTKCYSVRLQSLVSISNKAYKAKSFDGSTEIIPKSQVFGRDYDVKKSEAYWISAWILEQKNIQYSCKKEAWINEKGNLMPKVTIEKYTPEKIEPIKITPNELLIR